MLIYRIFVCVKISVFSVVLNSFLTCKYTYNDTHILYFHQEFSLLKSFQWELFSDIDDIMCSKGTFGITWPTVLSLKRNRSFLYTKTYVLTQLLSTNQTNPLVSLVQGFWRPVCGIPQIQYKNNYYITTNHTWRTY